MIGAKAGVYRLYEVSQNTTFYIGVTNNATRRWSEHIYAAANNRHELKYVAIRAFNHAGLDWKLEIINTQMDSEDFEIYQALLRGDPLTNMLKGAIRTEVENGAHYSSAAEYTAGVIHREEQRVAKAKAITLAAYHKPPKQQPGESAEMGSTKPPTTMSGGLAAIRARLNK